MLIQDNRKGRTFNFLFVCIVVNLGIPNNKCCSFLNSSKGNDSIITIAATRDIYKHHL